MKLAKEESILKIEVRANILKEILDTENAQRKVEARKAYEIYKDKTKKYVKESFIKKYDQSTVDEMEETLSNISVCKKIVDKKARVYKNGAIRTVEDGDKKPESLEKDQDQVDTLYDLVKFDRSMKKSNRFVELQKNTVVQVMPVKKMENGKEKYYIKARAILPFLYDVVEDANDPENGLVYILSSQKTGVNISTAPHSDRTDMRGAQGGTSFDAGNGRDEMIADAQSDEGAEDDEFIWWSEHYHFTTNSKGAIVASKTPYNNKNPIQKQTFYSLNKDQDGSYWAIGGDDLIDGSILINMLISNLHFIAEVQGMGLFYMFGKNIPSTFKVGINKGITVNVEEGDPTPSIGFATSNPPLQDHMQMIEQYIALLLSTNDLASSTVQGKLDASNAASGVADLITRSEVTSSIEDEQQMFLDAEPELFDIMRSWQNFYFKKGLLIKKFQDIGKISETLEINVKFLPFQEFLTEEQKLIIIEKRKDLGIDRMIDLIMRDNPDLDEAAAEKKLLQIMEEKLQNAGIFTNNPNEKDDENNKDDNENENPINKHKKEEKEVDANK